MGGKVLKPLAAITAITDNMSKDSLQEKLVGAGVDLSILGGSAAAGAAVGTAIPIPVVGTLAGAGVGILAGMAGDIKIGDKAVKDIAKDKINDTIDNSKKLLKIHGMLSQKVLVQCSNDNRKVYIMEKNLQKKSIETIQHSHLIGLSLVNFIIFAFYYFIYSGPGIKGIYLCI